LLLQHTPTILRVKKENGKLYAFNDEFYFEVTKQNRKKIIEDAKKYEFDLIDGHYYNEELWAKIPDVTIGKKVIKPESY
jgi:hypothetical protein